MNKRPENRPFIFLDRDGTLIVDVPYLSDPERIEFLPDALAGMHAFRRLGYGIILITNQSGIARGLLTEERLATIHDRLKRLLAADGLALDGLYYCPHRNEDHCSCRKPAPGMLKQAANDFPVDMARSFMIGDAPTDIQAGKRFGIKTIQILADKSRPSEADYQAASLLEAASILENM